MKDVIIDGYVTKNVEVRSTSSGQLVTVFSVNSPNYNRETRTSTPQFFNCEYWHNGNRDDKARNIVEGALLLMRGQLAYETWQDRQGNNRNSVKIRVREIGLIRAPQQSAPAQPPQPAPAPQPAPVAQPNTQHGQYPAQMAPQPAPVVNASIYDADIPF